MRKRMNLTVALFVLMILTSCFFTSCGDVGDEPAVVSLVTLLPGSPGYEGDGEVKGLLNGSYLVMHQKKQTVQEKDPAGRIQIFHEEDWYALDWGGEVLKIASSTRGIPALVENTPLFGGVDVEFPNAPSDDFYKDYYNERYNYYAVNSITGLVNGETYGVYRYGELSDGQRVGRVIGDLQTYNVNTVVNIKGLAVGESIFLVDRMDIEMLAMPSGVFNDNNHLVVLVDTGLYWTEIPLELTEKSSSGAVLRLIGKDFDIVIEKIDDSNGRVSVDAIKQDGQSHFIMTGNPNFKGRIAIASKE